MPFRVPTFPLTCRIYRASSGGPFPLTGGVTSPCQLQLRKDGWVSSNGGSGIAASMLLLLPKGTDIRPSHTTTPADAVQVPDDSGEYYVVSAVNDVAKGFPNEYRVAMLALQANKANGTVWPMP